jgi:hypothetical protein
MVDVVRSDTVCLGWRSWRAQVVEPGRRFRPSWHGYTAGHDANGRCSPLERSRRNVTELGSIADDAAAIETARTMRVELGLCFALNVTACASLTAGYHPIRYRASPGAHYKAVILKGGGGPVTRTTWLLEVLRNTEDVDYRNSTVAIQVPYYPRSSWTKEDFANVARIDIEWISKDSLVVSIDSRAKIEMAAPDFGDGMRLTRAVPDGVRVVLKMRYEANTRL